MFQQPIDFRDESDALYALLADLPDAEFSRPTQFKSWTINDVVSHLHAWNRAADLSLSDPEKFGTFRDELIAGLQTGRTLRELESVLLGPEANRERLQQWHDYSLAMAERFGQVEPKQRVTWAGPDMSVRSSITARLMETWSHGQELYDLLGVERIDTDRIKNIAVLGVNTFGWTFMNRGLEVPADLPYVNLTAPSGEQWTWNQPSTENFVAGSATHFCQAVTQVRNVADLGLEVVGQTAELWMSFAQCFAGPAEDPPPAGSRFTVSV